MNRWRPSPIGRSRSPAPGSGSKPRPRKSGKPRRRLLRPAERQRKHPRDRGGLDRFPAVVCHARSQGIPACGQRLPPGPRECHRSHPHRRVLISVPVHGAILHNVLGRVPGSAQGMVRAAVRSLFEPGSLEAAKARLSKAIHTPEPTCPKSPRRCATRWRTC